MAQIGFSIFGILCLLALAVLLSDNRKAINWRTVGGAFAIQAGLGAFVLATSVGQTVLSAIVSGVQNVINYTNEGIGFLLGHLGSPATAGGFIFAFHVLPIIIFFSAFVAVLYHLGIMQFVIKILGGALQKVLGTSRTETLSATANVFVGQTEAPLVVRPFIKHMSQSELFAVMVGGLASVAGSVMAGYASMGVELKYLVAASFMAAPGGLLMAKIMKPETEETSDKRQAQMDADADEKPANVLDAAAQGASSGLGLAANVGAMLLAFIALIAMVNGMLGGIGGWFGHADLSLQMILGYLFSPIALALGIPTSEMLQAGSLIGQKIVLNEFVAYIDFVSIKESLSAHSQAVITFALCGFANLSSIAILLGGLGSMAPERRSDIARMGIKAVLAGSLSNLMSAAIAGLFLAL
ncbi:NupC/NupG family nucleoside CNT transporter [Sansalvadorimonas verongulae]|uniref:NupC/NupG family nucleoside CNT transporter n=1 Tax=Sansalvadorimonas verongulae TaxID=2172824 RepID=UPI0012BD4486|nr:NupC/NupG family nucleoside CNT transporter [Sansalvadorimonas verongulae]MTI14789.1 NupC/NupG family nucleoside CNT transporter [Sansalvadorimonas verongulae]